MAIKLNKANAMLSKLRHVLDSKTLRSVCYAIFESHLCYASLWKVYYHLPSVVGSNSCLNHPIMIPGQENLIPFNFLFTKLKPMVDIWWSLMQYMFGITDIIIKLPLQYQILSVVNKQTEKDTYYIFFKLIQLSLLVVYKVLIYQIGSWFAKLSVTQPSLAVLLGNFHLSSI